ncbi:glycine zipper 2TM domain-containing protein [Halomonas denitrificans]|uniref:glycine zipper 2TM domain-containing protein n=1 Tax=Halomonas denitrificans TaxID=370769 RepID=UPI000D35D7BE|nr:glycine zipper 2TM domain-containing protein [Halomonas denitrificans]
MKTLHNTTHRWPRVAVAALLALGLTACSGMSTQDRNTVLGAGAGAVGGSILTGGSTTGTLGGAAIGGIIGHEVDGDD